MYVSELAKGSGGNQQLPPQSREKYLPIPSCRNYNTIILIRQDQLMVRVVGNRVTS